MTATTSGSTGISAGVKYVVLGVITVVTGVVTYVAGHPQLTEATIIGAILVAMPLIAQEFEGA